jgi:hypothetical protein
MIAFHANGNLILQQAFKSKSNYHRIAAYNAIMVRLVARGLSVNLQILNNETSTAYKEAITFKQKAKFTCPTVLAFHLFSIFWGRIWRVFFCLVTTSKIRSNRLVVIFMVLSLIRQRETLSYVSTMCSFRNHSLYHGASIASCEHHH